MAARDARAPMSAAVIVVAGEPALPIPVRVRIHSSVVSTIFVRSSFVTTRSGRYRPVPAKVTMARACSRRSLSFWGSPSSSVMSSTSPDRTARAATRIAFRMALGDEPPWQMIVTPSTPRSGTPPYSE
jgi:hypothetical protein